MPRGACFDFNGVIVNDERHHCLALRSTLADHGITLGRADYYRDYLGYDDASCFRHAWRAAKRKLTDPQLGELVATKGERYRALLDADLTLVPGIQPFIHALIGADVRLVIVSAAQRWEIEHVLEVAALTDCFTAIVSASDVGKTKPDPEGYLRGLALLNLPTRDCVVIEDSLPGLRAGRSAGMSVTMVATSHSRELLQAEAPERLWDDFVGHTPEELPWNHM